MNRILVLFNNYNLLSLFYILCLSSQVLIEVNGAPRLNGQMEISHSKNDEILNKLDSEMNEISDYYMQSLFSGTFNAEIDERLQLLESQINEHMDTLYFQNRFTEYIIYESRIAHKMQVLNMLKRLFGFEKFIKNQNNNNNNNVNDDNNDNSLSENLFNF